MNYVAILDGDVVATLWLRANQPGLGVHVANSAHMVAPNAHRKGIGKQIGLARSLTIARNYRNRTYRLTLPDAPHADDSQ
ncbi:MAG: GNAT family N-acetyltransferase [Acidobacteriota bacterium]